MEKTKLTSSNKGLLFLSIITFLLSWYPNMQITYKLYLLISSIIILGAIFVLSYFSAINKLETKIEELIKEREIDKRLIKIENLLKI